MLMKYQSQLKYELKSQKHLFFTYCHSLLTYCLFSVTYSQICVTHVENHLNLKRNRKDNFTSILITFFSLIAKEFEKEAIVAYMPT